jgi:hypothetical protein
VLVQAICLWVITAIWPAVLVARDLSFAILVAARHSSVHRYLHSPRVLLYPVVIDLVPHACLRALAIKGTFRRFSIESDLDTQMWYRTESSRKPYEGDLVPVPGIGKLPTFSREKGPTSTGYCMVLVPSTIDRGVEGFCDLIFEERQEHGTVVRPRSMWDEIRLNLYIEMRVGGAPPAPIVVPDGFDSSDLAFTDTAWDHGWVAKIVENVSELLRKVACDYDTYMLPI